MRVPASSQKAQTVLAQLNQVQDYFVNRLQRLSVGTDFEPIEWLRDEGKHGGGRRLEAMNNTVFNRASVNVSQIQFEDIPDKMLLSATALSTIIHPQHPLAPSVHLHISWTELKNGQQYWRLMADLNPAIVDNHDTLLFNNMLQKAAGPYYTSGVEQGLAYFYIPALKQHRGVSHFYLEGFTGDANTPEMFAIDFATQVIDCYVQILDEKLARLAPPDDHELQQQLDYHTLYFYQVLTLDKGTTAGLLVHHQNDIGTLASLPAYINRDLLAYWATQTPLPQQLLVKALVALFPQKKSVLITHEIKQKIALCIRAHYKQHA